MKQLTFFDLIPEEENKEADLCETCRYFEKGCCSYNEPLGRYCVLGDAYEFKAPEKEPPTMKEANFDEIMDYIIQETRLNFEKVEAEGAKYYIVRPYKYLTIEIDYSRFDPGIFGGVDFLGVDHMDKRNHSGSGVPCTSIEQAINRLEMIKKEYKIN